ncbi:glycosyltransferase family 39 protein [Curtobacterium sp. Leaf261]|uniref:glycosyltransferase family 39 protein n=1 Tax=Curtobacterium sp. Leaf261 TaxID=1736311 RepID=UPI00138F6E5B|nr:glycosyltransferase family 39 protein [Curtobacterium sp. Leaf261]
MSSPHTDSISVQRPSRAGSSLRALTGSSVRETVVAVATTAVRVPEITVGALAFLVSAVFAWVPSLWYDEGATVTSATRSWAALWAELQHVDAVHGLYYALMHAWFWLVGYTPFTLRLPSALAVGVAAGLVVAVGRRIGGTRLGVVSGIAFLVLPRVVWAGGEGRPYATITTLSVALTLVGLTAVRRTRGGVPWSRAGLGWWIGYGAVAAVAVTFNVYLALVVVAHGVALVWTLLAQRAAAGRADRAADVGGAALGRGTVGGLVDPPLVSWRVSRGWLVAGVVAAVLVVPVVVLVMRQSTQVAWIGAVGPGTVRQVFRTAWFGGSTLFATVAWLCMVLAVVLVLRAARGAAPTARELLRAQAVRVVLPLVVVPTALLLIVTAAGEHLYSPKYATLSLPFVALLIGLALTAIRPRVTLAIAVLALVAISIPTTVAVKTPHSKQDSHWANAAAIVERQRSLAPDADEGVVFGSVWQHPSTTTQIIRDTYPTAFAGMTDLAATTSGAQTGQLWDTNGDITTTVPSRLGDIDTVWYLGAKSRSIRHELTTTLEAEGFTESHEWMAGTTVVSEYTRAPR